MLSTFGTRNRPAGPRAEPQLMGCLHWQRDPCYLWRMINGLDHVTLIVNDLSVGKAAYQQLLGAAPSYEGHYPELGTASALFGLDNGLIELVGPSAGDDRAAGLLAQLQEHGAGLHALAFGSDDVAAFRAAARERGLRVSPPEAGQACGRDGTTRTFTVVEISPRDSAQVSLLTVQRSDQHRLRARDPSDPSSAHALDHIVIRTADGQRALRLYGEQLGLRLALDKTIAGHRMLFFRTGGVTVEVVESADQGATDQLWGLAYRVRDLHAAHARLTAAGFAVSEPRAGRKPGTQVMTVRDGTANVPTLFITDPSRDAPRAQP